jgi:hypothetical protein
MWWPSLRISTVSLRVLATQSHPCVQRMMRADNEHRVSTGLADQYGREIPIIALKPTDIVRALESAYDPGLIAGYPLTRAERSRS